MEANGFGSEEVVKMRTRALSLLGLIVFILGLYVLPSVTARLAGSHTWELNSTGGIEQLSCNKCHKYITYEIDAIETWDWGSQHPHQAAATDSNYVGNNKWINISAGSLPQVGGGMVNFCLMCHEVEQGSVAFTQGHTKVTIRACTDGDCHGTHSDATQHTNKQGVFGGQALNISEKLSLSVDAHSRLYLPLNTTTSTYVQEGDGDSADSVANGNYTQGFYACIGCHTHVGVQMNVIRPQIINFSMTGNGFSFSVSSVNVNTTSLNATTSYGTTGNKWT